MILKDLRHIIIEADNARLTVFPTILEDGAVTWYGSITMPGQTIATIEGVPSKEIALQETLKALKVYIGSLLALSKAVMVLADKRGT